VTRRQSTHAAESCARFSVIDAPPERRVIFCCTYVSTDPRILPAVQAAQLRHGEGSLLLASGTLEAPIALCRLRQLSLPMRSR